MVNDVAVQEFVNAIKETPTDTNTTYSATVSKVDDEGVVWVRIHGGNKETPTASTSTEVKSGDVVTVQWRNNKLYIGGNYSNPSAGIGTVQPSVDYVSQLIGKDITVNSINAASAYIGELEAKNIKAEDITADHATIKELDVESMAAATAYIRDLTAENITADDIIADHATVGTIAADYVSTGDLEAVTGRIDDLEANELVVNDTLKATNASIEYLESDWISTDRLVLTGNNKNNYPPVQITESEFNVNKTAYWTKDGDTYTQCTQSSVYDPDEQYYVRQTVKSIIEAINTANSTDPQVVISNDKLIAASMDVAELSAITADMGELTAGKIQKGNNFINLNTSPATMEFKNASTWNSATQGLQFDAQGNLNIKGKVEITSSDTIPTKIEAQGYASTAESNAKGYADGVAATAQKYATAVYGTCTATGASTAAKVVTLADFKLFTGAQITVKFTNANTAEAPTLNVNSTGAKAIYVNKAVTSSSNPLLWAAGAELHFTYDGSYWNCDDVGYGYSTICSVAATTAAKTGAQTGAIITNGTTVALTCTYANTVEGALTFNFASTGAASIYQHNAITSSSNALVWSAGATVTFVRRGAYWYYVASTTIDGDNIKTGKIKANLGGSYIDLDSGDMLLGDASTYEASTQGLMWDESNGSLKIKGQITVETGSNVYSTTEADTAIGNAVDGIQVGGRNLIPLSQNLKSFTVESATLGPATFTNVDCYVNVVTTNTSRYGIYYDISVSANTQYTLSFRASGVTGDVGYAIGNRTGDNTGWNDVMNYVAVTNGTNSSTFTVPSGVTKIRIYIGGKKDSHWYIWKIKLEIGNKATDWTPALNDTPNVHNVTASGSDASYPYANILTYSEETNSLWNIGDNSGLVVGDTVRIKVIASDMGTNGTPVYITGTVSEIPSNNTHIRIDAHGLDTTVIDGGHILTGTIDANKVNISSLTVGTAQSGWNGLMNSEVQVGGKNLCKNTGFNDLSMWYGSPSVSDGKLTITTATEVGISVNYRTSYTIPAGTSYTVSCYFYENTIADGNRRIYFIDQPVWDYWTVPANFTGLFSRTSTASQDLTRLTVEYDTRNATSGKWVVGPVKIELGNKATDWTPAPEDVQSEIDAARKTATDNITTIDSSGIWVTPSGLKPTNTSTGAGATGTRINSSGMQIFKGGTSVAEYGDTARIGKSNAGNVYVDTDSVDIRNGSTVLSTFTSSGAELGKNSDTASIKMCANKFGIKGSYRTTVSSNDTFVATIDNEHTGLYKLLQLQSGGWLALDDFNGLKRATMSVGNAQIIAEHDETDGNSIQATVTDDSFTNEATLTVFPNRAEFSGGNFVVDGGNIKNLYGYNDTVSSKPNMYIGTTGLIHRTTYIVDNTSSKRFKHDIKDVTNPTIDPHLLYDIEVKQFRFNDDTEASRKGIDLIGFIAEQVEEVYPIAVDYDENGQVETWREHYIIPPMLKLIQEQHEQIEALTKRIEALERKSND